MSYLVSHLWCLFIAFLLFGCSDGNLYPFSDLRNSDAIDSSELNTDVEAETDTDADADTNAGLCSTDELLIYEPFDDDDMTLDGNSGGLGLTSPYSGGSGAKVQSGSLAYGDLVSSGNKLAFSGSNSFASISLDSTLLDCGLLADGATLWFSVIWDRCPEHTTNWHAGFALGTAALTTLNHLIIPESESSVGFLSWRCSAVIPGFWVNGSKPNSSEIAIPDQPTLIVGKISWGADSTVPDTVQLFLPGPDLELPAEPAGEQTAVVDQTQFDILSFAARGSPDSLDEIRFGASYEAVIAPGP